MELESLRLDHKDRVGVVTLTRLDALNTIGKQFIRDMETVLDAIETDDSIGALVIVGNDDVFVAGGDIVELQQVDSPLAARPLTRRVNALHNRIEALALPVIAALSGIALGGGCELALACDIRIAADNLKIGLPEVSLGLLPGSGGTQRLPRLIGAGRAKELLMSGRIITASEAERIGLVNRVVEVGTCLDAAMDLAQKLARQPAVAVATIKALVNTGMNTDLATGLELEQRGFELLFSTDDKAEGIRAFLEKRRPAFNGK